MNSVHMHYDIANFFVFYFRSNIEYIKYITIDFIYFLKRHSFLQFERNNMNNESDTQRITDSFFKNI